MAAEDTQNRDTTKREREKQNKSLHRKLNKKILKSEKMRKQHATCQNEKKWIQKKGRNIEKMGVNQ